MQKFVMSERKIIDYIGQRQDGTAALKNPFCILADKKHERENNFGHIYYVR